MNRDVYTRKYIVSSTRCVHGGTTKYSDSSRYPFTATVNHNGQTASRKTTPRLSEHQIVLGAGSTGPCATIVIRISSFRSVNCHSDHSQVGRDSSLLRRWHSSRPRVRDWVISFHGRPGHIEPSLNGYSKDQLTK